jgi:hypothetical protein
LWIPELHEMGTHISTSLLEPEAQYLNVAQTRSMSSEKQTRDSTNQRIIKRTIAYLYYQKEGAIKSYLLPILKY